MFINNPLSETASLEGKLLFWRNGDMLVRFDKSVPITNKQVDTQTIFSTPAQAWETFGTFKNVIDGKRYRISFTELEFVEAPKVAEEKHKDNPNSEDTPKIETK